MPCYDKDVLRNTALERHAVLLIIELSDFYIYNAINDRRGDAFARLWSAEKL